ncbi:hypothetical protein ACO0LG_04720 [Undibacterium sp. Ji42W]|uniref:PGAP1-like alpha/beta domain-containing protein n=1 Tax=Undibacterium sp. Ji42W TaxID=3413039 RepID=UPI003BF26295
MPKNKAAVVFIHGLSKKPAPHELKRLWLWGLERDNPMPSVFAEPNRGVKLGTNGVTSSFCYYADVFYGEDYELDFQSYYEQETAQGDIAAEGLDQVETELPLAKGVTPREQLFLRAFEAKLQANLELNDPADIAVITRGAVEYEIAGFLPKAVRQAVIKKAAMEAYYYLFDKEYKRADGATFQVRSTLRNKLIATLAAARDEADKVILVSHSMGTMIAYDVLRNCPDCVPVDTLITLGSPLGIREVQDELIATDARQIDFPAEKLVNWINIYDPLDPICGADPRFANDFLAVDGKSVKDWKESNWGSWRHTITHYLAGSKLRQAITEATGIGEASR